MTNFKPDTITENFPVAKTNAFQLLEENETLLKLLLSNVEAPLCIDFFTRQFRKEAKEGTKSFYQRVHREAQQIISGETGVVEVKNRYSWIKVGKTHYFFYLTDSPKPRESLVSDVLALPIPEHQLIQTILELRFNCFLFSKASDEFILSMTDAHSDLFLFSEVIPLKSPDKVFIESLHLNIYYSNYGRLFFNFRNKVFLSSLGEDKIARTEDGGILFKRGRKLFQKTVEVDARKHRQKKYMIFQKRYNGCVNQAQQVIYQYFLQMFQNMGMSAQPVTLQATNSIQSFLKPLDYGVKRSLAVVNTSAKISNDAIAVYFKQYMEESFDIEILANSEIQLRKGLDRNKTYLFINELLGDKSEGTIVNLLTGEQYKTFWQALKFKRSKPNGCEFDTYTDVKIDNFEEQKQLVCQGVNLKPTKKGQFTGANDNVLKRLTAELTLKAQVFIDKKVPLSEPLVNGEYTLIYIRKPEGMFFASVTNIVITNDTINISSQTIIDDEDELLFEESYLSNKGLKDRSFYLYDTTNKSLLTAYTSDAVPQIIGNETFDNNVRYKESGDVLRKLTGSDVNPLPYYINRARQGSYHQTFIFDDNTNYYYFVAPKGNPQSVFDRQLRVYNILLWGEDGALLPRHDHPLVNLYLSSFTDDILRNNQVSKTSIFAKIARLAVEN